MAKTSRRRPGIGGAPEKTRRSRRKRMAHRRRRLSFRLWSLAFLLALVAGLAGWMRWRTMEAPPYEREIALNRQMQLRTLPAGPLAFADSVASRAPAVLKRLGVPDRVVSVKRSATRTHGTARWVMTSDIPGTLPLAVCNLQLTRLARRLGGDVIEAVEDRKRGRLSMFVGIDGVRTNQIILKRKRALDRMAGRIAIIVADFGHQDEALVRGFCALKQTITLSVFPGPGKIRVDCRTGGRGRTRSHGVYVDGTPGLSSPGPGSQHGVDGPSAGKSQVADFGRRVRTCLRRTGLNNHMGSRLTEDPTAIGRMLEEVDRHGLFFVDSFTSPRSKAWSVAEEKGIPAGRNSMFLDQERNAGVGRTVRGGPG